MLTSTSSRQHKLTSNSGDNPYFEIPETDSIPILNKRLLSVYTSKRSEVKSRTSFICLSPHARSYGGWGNVVYYAMTMMQLSLWLPRVPVMNHAVVLGLFDHPDKSQQDWTLLSIQDIVDTQSSINGFQSCRGIPDFSPAQFPAMFGLHGCPDGYQYNKYNVEYFSTTLNFKDISSYISANTSIYTDERGRRIGQHHLNLKDVHHWLINSVATHWTFSNPTAEWSQAVKDYKTLVLNGQPDLTLDLAVQFRSYRDLGDTELSGTFENTGGPCAVQCVTLAIDQLTRVHDRDIHVFYTGDDPRYIQRIVAEVNLHYNNVTSTPGSGLHKLYAYTFQNTFSLQSWHTGDIMNKDRYHFNFSHVQHDPGMLDWMLLSEARHAVYTMESG